MFAYADGKLTKKWRKRVYRPVGAPLWRIQRRQ